MIGVHACVLGRKHTALAPPPNMRGQASQRYACSHTTTLSPTHHHPLCRFCCRLMVQTQQLWVSALSSATGRCKYSVSGPGLPVSLPEHLVGSCSLGDVVHLIGHASIKPTPGPSSSCAVQVRS